MVFEGSPHGLSTKAGSQFTEVAHKLLVGLSESTWREAATVTGQKSKAGQALSAPFRVRASLLTQRESGQSLLEFALVAPLFVFLIFALLDFGRMFFVQMEVQQAIQEAGRFASTGNHLPDPKNPSQYLSRVDSIIRAATQAAGGVDVSAIQISSLRGGPGSAGGPGDVVTISLTTNLKLMTPVLAPFFPNGQYTFKSSATFKNEPFSPGQTN